MHTAFFLMEKNKIQCRLLSIVVTSLPLQSLNCDGSEREKMLALRLPYTKSIDDLKERALQSRSECQLKVNIL